MPDLFLGGMFNTVDPVVGWPLYIWEYIASIILIVVANYLMKWMVWTPLTPLHGLYYGWKNGSGCAFIADKNLIAEMVSENVAKCIFDYSKDEYEIEVPYANTFFIGWFTRKIYTFLFWYPTKYLQNIKWTDAIKYKLGNVNRDVEIARHLQNGEWDKYPSVICGGVAVDIIVDTNSWTIPNSKQHNAIVKSAREWNKDHPNDQVHSYSKYQRYITPDENGEVKITPPPEIETTYLVDWGRIDVGFPLDLEENDWAGKRRQMALDRIKDMDMPEIKKMAFLVAGGGIIIFLVEVVFRFINLMVFHAPH